ncbi:MAG: ATP-binding protein [Thermoguttaceae bacterium]|nr:ATP-binding protein [Thermoguttaceae bacterium]MDW8079944.1 ATP-binding protein [Thermoguttaceae bacterium]
MIDLSELFPSLPAPQGRYRPLAWVAEVLQEFSPVLLVLTDCAGGVLVADYVRPELAPPDTASFARELVRRVQLRRFATFPFPESAQPGTAFGLRLSCDTLGAILGGVCCPSPNKPLEVDKWLSVLETCGRLVWAIQEKEAEARRALARKEQFRQQCVTLEKAYAQLFEEVNREQENRLRQAQEYSSRLEREVEARSLALREAAEHAARQAEQLRLYSAALEQALIAHEQLTEAAEAASRAKSEFLANISHELRTPLTAILGHADLLSEHVSPGSVAAHSVEVIRRNGRHLLAIIDDLLDLAKAEAGRLTVELVPVAIEQLLEQVVELMEVRASEKGLPLLVDSQDLPPAVVTDPTRLKQILINLVGNAIKFTERGQVLIRARFRPESPQRGQLVLEVVDTGVGIAPEALQRLFRPFEQAHSSIARRFGGTGLGLAICKRLSELLGGRIEAESTPHVGSTFRVILPVDVEHEVPRQAESECRRPAELPRLQGRVLVVDDSPDNRLILQRFLELAGAEVVLATNGREAVEIILAQMKLLHPEESLASVPTEMRAGVDEYGTQVRGAIITAYALAGGEEVTLPQPHFDLILMDLQMPEMDGFTATQILRSKGCNTPIVALTACTTAEEREECLRRGFDGFMPKPVDRAQFLAEVARFLGSSQ